MSIRSRMFECVHEEGVHNIRVLEYGRQDSNNILICVHGVGRNAHDFDYLANVMAPYAKIVCVDLVGHGASEWLDAKTRYVKDTYMKDVGQVIASYAGANITYIGSSLGGILGMHLAAQSNSGISHLVLVDSGPVIPVNKTAELSRVLAMDITFDDLSEVEACLRMGLKEIGDLPDALWQKMASTSVRPRIGGGGYGLAFDPGIAEPFKNWVPHDICHWEEWMRISCPVLVIRGERSTHLSAQTMSDMVKKGRQVRGIEMPRCGHAPHLMSFEHIQPVKSWLIEKWAENSLTLRCA